jgi:hypothetical protein
MSKPIKEQLLEKGLLKLAGHDKAKLHKAYRIKKCRHRGNVCGLCTEWQYKECLASYGPGKD